MSTPASSLQIHGGWNAHRVNACYLLALLPPTAAAVYAQGTPLLISIVLASAVALACQTAFCRWRGRPFGADALVAALIFCNLISVQMPLFQQALAVSFGVLIGSEIFGGRGRSFLNPAVVALAFAHFSFPGALTHQADMPVGIAAALAGVLLWGAGLLSLRVLAGAGLGMAGIWLITDSAASWSQTLNSSVIFGLIWLAGDPVGAASTNLGRWLYGLLTGALLLLIGAASGAPGSTHALVFAVLLASVFAPLIDQLAIAHNLRQRRKRYA